MREEKLKYYIEKANIAFDNKYDYSKCNPSTCKDKCVVICPIHGEFLTTMDNHVSKKTGCPKCAGKNKTNKEFIEEIKLIHGDRYDYSKVKYVNAKTKICIICPEHGEFYQEPRHHLSGCGCITCAGIVKSSTEEFAEKANLVHDNKYDYSKVVYEGNHKKICIMCPEHGGFYQEPISHLSGCGCPKCANSGVLLTTEEFIEKAKNLYGDKYDYSKVEYINAHDKVCIICKKHGEFWQEASSHLCGRECPKCKTSKLESIVMRKLEINNIDYVYQYKLKDLGGKSLDFFLPKYNIIIECQGEQHYIPTSFSKNSEIDTNLVLEKRKVLDKEKYDICHKNDIKIIYFTIPEYFHVKDVNINTFFYSDKIVFTQIDVLIDYILNL